MPFPGPHPGAAVDPSPGRRRGPAYDLITFDLDGTLVDTAAEIAEAANRTLQQIGRPPAPVDRITRLIGGGGHELMAKLLASGPSGPSGLDGPRTAVSAEQIMPLFDAHYAEIAGTVALPYPGCLEALTALKAAGIRLACVTNKNLRHARAVLKACGLDVCFELVIGGDSLPEKKPHASVLRHVAGALCARISRTAHVGDSAIDVQAARHAGAEAWAVPYGYNAGRPIVEAAPDRIFASLRDVAAFVLAGSHANPSLSP